MVCIAIQGAPGCVSEDAARRAFHPQRPEFIHCSTCAEAVELVHQGKADHAFVPIENSTTGTMEAGHLAAVSSGLKKGKTTWHDVELCLVGLRGTRVDDVTTIYSHADALAACSHFIEMHNWTARAWRDTAEAAAEIVHQGQSQFAAICTESAASLHHLEVLRHNIQDRDDHRTKFVALSQYKSKKPERRPAAAFPQ